MVTGLANFWLARVARRLQGKLSLGRGWPAGFKANFWLAWVANGLRGKFLVGLDGQL